MRRFIVLTLALICMGASCKPLVEDSGLFAAEAGESTIVLGACESNFNKGWTTCLVEKGSPMPKLRFVVTNPAEWAVSDCGLGIFKTGSSPNAGVIELDLLPLSEQAKQQGICILKIETVETYSDPRDTSQKRKLYMRGGFIMEQVEPGYFPTPTNDVVSFCVKVARTTKGRTKIENCVP